MKHRARLPAARCTLPGVLGVTLRRALTDADVRCPAAQLHGDATIECKVERSLIDGRLNPDTVALFCCGDHAQCPSWQAERDAGPQGALAAAEKQKLSPEMREQQAARKAALIEAKRLMDDPGPEGQRFRRKLMERIERSERARVALARYQGGGG